MLSEMREVLIGILSVIRYLDEFQSNPNVYKIESDAICVRWAIRWHGSRDEMAIREVSFRIQQSVANMICAVPIFREEMAYQTKRRRVECKCTYAKLIGGSPIDILWSYSVPRGINQKHIAECLFDIMENARLRIMNESYEMAQEEQVWSLRS